MGTANLINYKGLSIFYMDFSNLRTEKEITDLIEKSKLYIRSKAPASVITLTNITNMHFNSDIKEHFTTFVKGNKPYVKAGSVVGISGLQSIVYNAIMKITGRNLKAMSSLEEAKEWLVLNS